jgi:hypothetical protein
MFEIGNSLREARLRRKVDFAQAEQSTKIRGKYLRALEDEEFEILPSETYVKGFLRTYAEYLGLDGQLYVDEYNSRFVAGDEEARVRRNAATRHQRRNRRIETNVVLVALAVIAVVTIGVVGAWKSSGKPQAAPTVHRAPVVAPKPHVTVPLLWLRATKGDSFVVVHQGSATGRVRYEGTLQRGQTEQFTGTRLWVNVGSPDNLVIKVNGRVRRLAGHRPRVVVVTPSGLRNA